MDERTKELNELVLYGNRLLDELSSADANIVTMIRGVLTHIHGIAMENAADAAIWQGKYEVNEETVKTLKRQMKEQAVSKDTQVLLEMKTSLKKLKKVVKKIGKK